MYVVIVDTTQIQPYIFGSNRLKENIGASYLVAQATDAWAEGCLPAHMKKLYAGGGNFVVLADDEGSAQTFTRELSKKVLAEAPGLQLVTTYRQRAQGETLATAVQNTFTQLARQKQARAHKEPLLGLGVTVMCRSTALPAVGEGGDKDDRYPASAEILAKLGVNDDARKRLIATLRPPEGFSYPRDFDDLGREKGEQSHIAVVHADGNEMGKKFQDIIKEHLHNEDDEAYKVAVRLLSARVQEAAIEALKATLDTLVKKLTWDEAEKRYVIRHANRDGEGELLAKIVLPDGKKDNEGYFLPFRPLVFGGDDVTFVCDGRLGISLAIEYLKQFEIQTTAIVGEKLTACAGIAIVKSHYPFARAYGLAEELCGSAKKYRTQNNLEASCLDWHFALTGLSGDIGEIRRREYTTYQEPEKLKEEATPRYKGERLTLRPLTLNGNPVETHRSFAVVYKGVAAFQDLELVEDQEPQWSNRRNKVKALRDALRDGPVAVRRFINMYNLTKLPPIDESKGDFQSSGWWGNYCGYFDAIEMMDWFIPLEAKQS
ncbi:MAG: hypothetical protein IT327_32640 [Anaerolineae bacterium]|nr:hypothetical protein [Anaerolineae bacterium]